MQKLSWESDQITEHWAIKIDLIGSTSKAEQYDGHWIYTSTWSKYTVGRFMNGFPTYCGIPSVRETRDGCVFCSPRNIIQCLREDYFLEGLALTVAWGGMQRRMGSIYPPDLGRTERILKQCGSSIRATTSIEAAWRLLEDCNDGMGWNVSPVILSKFLGFLCRALGFEMNAPGALDGAVLAGEYRRVPLKQSAWPDFISRVRWERAKVSVEQEVLEEPGKWWDWAHESWWTGYCRYMTVINCWAQKRNWTTTEVEATLFKLYS